MSIPARCFRQISKAKPVHPLRCSKSRSGRCLSRSYHTLYSPSPSPYNPTESAILSAALSHVPSHGFSPAALTLGARDAGYIDPSTNVLPRGVFEIVLWHLVSQRLGLGARVQFPEAKEGKGGMGTGHKVRVLVMERLRGNVEAGVVGRWQEALAIMAHPTYVPASLRELAHLADEIWYLAGDTSVDTSWYTKRASLSTIYSATELFMTQDQSTDFKDTERFLDARLEDLRVVGGAVGNLGEWLEFTGHSIINVLRSKGVRI
ncbi:ubiquinone biosynthesis protein COQ9 [Patellaria atrata CBS 101060]|uniref:Ubiquinone biosynthesis protein n=1 Tax=Patellaria atrata CBS 101060 TaxID=1346257 RepID=A0A9P4VL35_9PEZI|nr:ubiquinone biosynthesis protein COQ9 [Patellaria atrata CBS 101060]